MRSPIALSICTVIAIEMAHGPAHATNASDALDELKEGYALKQADNCPAAMAHFARSFQLDPKPKALLNLSDCERKMADLVAAQLHAAAGRQLARQQNDATLVSVADEQLAEIERRLPQLIIALAPGAPATSTVTRDGAAVGVTSLLVPFGVNPGKHVITVVAPGHAERRVDVTLEEGARQQVDVAPGDEVSGGATAAAASPEVGAFSTRPEPVAGGQFTTGKVVAVALAGVGLVGIGIGSVYGLDAIAKNNGVKAPCHVGDPCASPLKTASEDTTAANIAFGVGLAAIAG